MTQRSILVALPLLVLAALWGCDNDTSNDVAGPPGGGGTDKTCIGCHSSEAELKAALGIEDKGLASAKDLALKFANKDDG